MALWEECKELWVQCITAANLLWYFGFVKGKQDWSVFKNDY